MSKRILLICVIVTVGMLSGIAALSAEDALQPQIDAIKAVLPKFAIPMREVGDRFQNMYFAAQGGNWGLAAYMSKYMNNSMNPASLTKPKEYPVWKNFYERGFAPVNSAIQAQDFKAFTTAFDNAIQSCNACHIAMGMALSWSSSRRPLRTTASITPWDQRPPTFPSERLNPVKRPARSGPFV